jgi:hypothetical protein
MGPNSWGFMSLITSTSEIPPLMAVKFGKYRCLFKSPERGCLPVLSSPTRTRLRRKKEGTGMSLQRKFAFLIFERFLLTGSCGSVWFEVAFSL